MAGKGKSTRRVQAKRRSQSSAAKTLSAKSSSVKASPEKRSSAKKADAKKKKATGAAPGKVIKKKATGAASGKVMKKKAPGKASGKGTKKALKTSALKVAGKKPTGGAKAVKRKVASKKSPVKKLALRRKKPTPRWLPPVKPPFEAYRGIRPFLFVSYAHRNMKDVFRILKKMNEGRYRIWYDEGIEPGNEWPEVVGTAVVKCSQYVVFMTPAAAVSRNVRNEVNLAFAENKEIIVVYLQETNLTSGMKLQIGTVQHINRYEMGEKEFYEKLFKVLRGDLRG